MVSVAFAINSCMYHIHSIDELLYLIIDVIEGMIVNSTIYDLFVFVFIKINIDKLCEMHIPYTEHKIGLILLEQIKY